MKSLKFKTLVAQSVLAGWVRGFFATCRSPLETEKGYVEAQLSGRCFFGSFPWPHPQWRQIKGVKNMMCCYRHWSTQSRSSFDTHSDIGLRLTQFPRREGRWGKRQVKRSAQIKCLTNCSLVCSSRNAQQLKAADGKWFMGGSMNHHGNKKIDWTAWAKVSCAGTSASCEELLWMEPHMSSPSPCLNSGNCEVEPLETGGATTSNKTAHSASRVSESTRLNSDWICSSG